MDGYKVSKEGQFVFVWCLFGMSRMEQKNVLNQKMDNICRICLHEFHIMSPIFKKSHEEFEESVDLLSLADKISSFAQVQVGAVAFTFSALRRIHEVSQ